jgi:hypothetical protein
MWCQDKKERSEEGEGEGVKRGEGARGGGTIGHRRMWWWLVMVLGWV